MELQSMVVVAIKNILQIYHNKVLQKPWEIINKNSNHKIIKIKTLNFQQIGVAEGGITNAAQNAGCFYMGVAAGLAPTSTIIGPWTAQFVGGLTVAGRMLLTDYQH